MTPTNRTLETLCVGSVEAFLTASERTQLSSAMGELLASHGRAKFDEARASTIHEIPGQSVEAARAVYEPAGRVEIVDLPGNVAAILEQASARALPIVQTYAPSVRFARPWTYVEYGVGQFISAHVDRVAPAPEDRPWQLLGVSVALNEDFQGGEFFVETTADPRLWSGMTSEGLNFVHTAADTSSEWFKAIPKTKWLAKSKAGDALLYGSQVAHGTVPIVRGRAKKFISWFAA